MKARINCNDIVSPPLEHDSGARAMFNHFHAAPTTLSALVALSFASLPTLIGLAWESPKDRSLKPGKPEDAGLSASRLDQASQILDKETASGRILAASILVARHGSIVLQR